MSHCFSFKGMQRDRVSSKRVEESIIGRNDGAPFAFAEGNVQAVIESNAQGRREVKGAIIEISIREEFGASRKKIENQSFGFALFDDSPALGSGQRMARFGGENIGSD